jgi:hypothetical protein
MDVMISAHKIFVEDVKGRGVSEDLSVDVRIILEWTSQK